MKIGFMALLVAAALSLALASISMPTAGNAQQCNPAIHGLLIFRGQ